MSENASNRYPSWLCEHANESPRKCLCPSDCYCKSHSCKPQYKLKELSGLTDEDRKAIYDYAIKRSGELMWELTMENGDIGGLKMNLWDAVKEAKKGKIVKLKGDDREAVWWRHEFVWKDTKEWVPTNGCTLGTEWEIVEQGVEVGYDEAMAALKNGKKVQTGIDSWFDVALARDVDVILDDGSKELVEVRTDRKWRVLEDWK